MKSRLGAVMVAGLVSTCALAGPALDWGSDNAIGTGPAPDVKDRFGVVVPTDSTFLAELIRASDNTVLYTGSATFWSAAGSAGVGYDALTADDGWNGLSVRTRIREPGPSTWYAVTAPSTLSWTVTPPTTSISYNFGEITQPMWVPEPGTGILVLAGAALMIFRRRRTAA